jgi:hypothetical protein
MFADPSARTYSFGADSVPVGHSGMEKGSGWTRQVLTGAIHRVGDGSLPLS